MTGSDDLRLVVFDCDGTLIDSFAAIVQALEGAWQSVGRTPPAPHLLRATVGLPLEGAIMRLDRGLSERQLTAIARHYRETLSVRDNFLRPGVHETMEALRGAGVCLGIATGMGRWRLDHVLQQHGLGDLFDTLQTGDTNPGKPNPQMLLAAMAETGSAPARTVMIGDSVHDMAMARNAAVTAVGISWGAEAGPTLKMAGAAHVVDTLAEVSAVVDRVFADGA